MSLMYNTAKDQPVTRNQLAHFPTPEGRGRFHQPYPFSAYVTDVLEALDRQSIAVVNEEYAVTKDHNRLFGLLEIEPPALEGELIRKQDWNLLLGLRGSHDQSLQRGLVLGDRVTVCSNLCFFGNIADFKTKQTLYLRNRLPRLISEAVSKIPALAERQVKVFEAYRNKELSPRHGDAGLVEVFRRGGLTAAQLGRAVGEWHSPSHAEHAEQGFTVWRFRNACTEALKPTGEHVNMELVNQRSQIVTRFANEITGLAA